MLVALAAAALLFAQAVPASSDTARPVPVAKSDAPEKPKLICTTEIPTGTKFAQRICRTPEEAKALEDDARNRSDAMRACKSGMGC